TGPAGENVAHAVDADAAARLAAPAHEEIAALAVQIGERQPGAAALRRGADLGHLHQAVPQPVAVDPQVGLHHVRAYSPAGCRVAAVMPHSASASSPPSPRTGGLRRMPAGVREKRGAAAGCTTPSGATKVWRAAICVCCGA